MEFTTEQIAEIVKATVNAMETKAAGTSANFTPLHGTTDVGSGIFSGQGLEREVISTVVRPFGIASVLSMIPSVDTDPRYPSLTGVSDDIGDEASEVCGAAPTGYIKGCNLTSRFGRILRDTQTIDQAQVFLKKNRGDFKDLILLGRMLGIPNFNPAGLNENQVLDFVTINEMVQTGVRMERILNKMLWNGSPSNNNGTGYYEFPGFSVQVATGQKDADSGTLCPSLDSDIKDFAYNNVSGVDGRDIVEYAAMLESYLRNNASTMGLTPVRWVIAMRPQLWTELSAVWPCAYNTNRCGAVGGDNARVFTDGRENIRDRDAMRTGNYIDINGIRYEVVADDGIFEHNNINNANLNPGEYASSIYFIPISINGGFEVTYMEYVDYKMAVPETNMLRGKEMFWTDDGRFFWSMDGQYTCYNLKMRIEPRLVMRTPQLAGRIDNVKYIPLQHLRDSDPDSPYHKDGGVSFRSTTVGQAVWA